MTVTLMSAISQHRWLLLVGLLAIAGCAGLNDPYRRAGTWDLENLNNANIASMASHPHDLVAGVNDPVSPGQLSAAAVHRLLTDRVKPLPDSSLSGLILTGSGAAPPAAAGADDGT